MFWLEAMSSDFQRLTAYKLWLEAAKYITRLTEDDAGEPVLHLPAVNTKEVEEVFREIFKSQVSWATVVIFITANGPTGKHRKTNCCQTHSVGIYHSCKVIRILLLLLFCQP